MKVVVTPILIKVALRKKIGIHQNNSDRIL